VIDGLARADPEFDAPVGRVLPGLRHETSDDAVAMALAGMPKLSCAPGRQGFQCPIGQELARVEERTKEPAALGR
jgi:hypothetical protein